MKTLSSYFFFSFLTISLLFNVNENLYARVYTGSGQIIQYDGPVESSDVTQKVLQIVLNVGAGGGTPDRTSMTFSLTGKHILL